MKQISGRRMIMRVWVACLSFSLMLGACVTTPHPQPSPLASLNPTLMPTSSSSAIQPSLTPSALTSIIPSPNPHTIPSHNPFDTKNLEPYYRKFYRSNSAVEPHVCEALSSELIQSRIEFRHPVDFAVSADGQKLYFTFSRIELAQDSRLAISAISSPLPTIYKARQFIYVVHQGKLDILKEAGTEVPPISCGLDQAIENDQEGNLYLVDQQKHILYRFTSQQKLVKVFENKEFEEFNELPIFSKIDRKKGDPIEREGPYEIKYFANKLYWHLEERSLRPASFLSWELKKFNLQTHELKSVTQLPHFFESEKGQSKSYLFEPHYYKLYLDVLTDFLSKSAPNDDIHKNLNEAKQEELIKKQIDSFPIHFRINREDEIFWNSKSAIYKLAPKLSNEEVLWVGHATETGFKDGQMQEARFNGLGLNSTTDAFGNLYFLDYGNKAVRKIAPNGMVSTVYIWKETISE